MMNEGNLQNEVALHYRYSNKNVIINHNRITFGVDVFLVYFSIEGRVVGGRGGVVQV